MEVVPEKNYREIYRTYFQDYSRPVAKLQDIANKFINISQGTAIKDFFLALTDEDKFKDDLALLTFLKCYFDYYRKEEPKDEAKEKKLASSAWMGRAVNISAFVFKDEDDQVHRDIKAVIEKAIAENPYDPEKARKVIEKEFQKLDKTAVRNAKKKKDPAPRRLYLTSFMTNLETAIRQSSDDQLPEELKAKLEILFLEALTTKNEKVEDAIYAALAAHLSKNEDDYLLAIEAYVENRGENRETLLGLNPDVLQRAALAGPPVPQRSLSQDLAYPDSEFRTALRKYAALRTLAIGSEFPVFAKFLDKLNHPAFLVCMYLVLEKFVAATFSDEKFNSSAFIGRCINGSAKFVLKDELLEEYKGSRKLLNPDKSFDHKERSKFMGALLTEMKNALEEAQIPLPDLNGELAKIIATAISDEIDAKLRQAILDILEEKLAEKNPDINADAIMSQAKIKAAEKKPLLRQSGRQTETDSLLVVTSDVQGTPNTERKKGLAGLIQGLSNRRLSKEQTIEGTLAKAESKSKLKGFRKSPAEEK